MERDQAERLIAVLERMADAVENQSRNLAMSNEMAFREVIEEWADEREAHWRDLFTNEIERMLKEIMA